MRMRGVLINIGGLINMNLRKLRQKQKKRYALNDERRYGKVYNMPDPTAKAALSYKITK